MLETRAYTDVMRQEKSGGAINKRSSTVFDNQSKATFICCNNGGFRCTVGSWRHSMRAGQNIQVALCRAAQVKL